MLKFLKRTKNDAKPKSRRTALQKIIRAVVVFGALLVILWAFLPWILPVESMAERFCRDAEDQIGAKIKYKRVTLSWGNGLEIEGLKIEQPTGFDGPEDMVIVDSVRIPFSPGKFIRGQIDYCDIRGLCINAELSEDGKLNLSAFKKLKMGTSPGEIKRLSLNESQIAFSMPQVDEKILFRIPNLQMKKGRVAELGKVCMVASVARQGARPAPVSMQFDAHGQDSQHVALGRFSFTGLDLSELPLPGGDFPISSLKGKCRGSLEFNVTRQLRIDSLRLELFASDFEMTESSGIKFARMDRAGIDLSASMDAMDQAINIKKFSLNIPGLVAQGKARIYEDFFQGNARAIENLHVTGQAQPTRLAELVGTKPGDDNLTIDGPVNFSFVARNDDRHIEIDADIDASLASISRNGQIVKPEDAILSISFESRRDVNLEDAPIELGGLNINVDTASITGGGTISNPEAVADVLATYDSAAPQELVKLLPNMNLRGTLVAYLPDSDKPVNGSWSIAGKRRSHIHLSLLADKDTPVSFGDFFIKPDNTPMEAEISAIIDSQSLDNIRIDTDLTLATAAASMDIKLTRDEDKNLTLAGTLNSKRTENFIQAMPFLSTDDVDIRGRINGRIVGHISADKTKPSDIKLDLDFKRLAVKYEDVFLKPLAGPMKMSASGAWTLDAQGSGDVKFIIVARDNTELATELGLECKLDKFDEIASLSAELMIKNLAALHRYSPEFQKQLDGGAISGGFYSSLSLQNFERHRQAKASIDFRDIACRGAFGELNINGRCIANSRITENDGLINIEGESKADKLAIELRDQFHKGESVDASAMWNIAIPKESTESGRRKIRIRTLLAKMGSAATQIGGSVYQQITSQGQSFTVADLHADASITDVSELMTFLPRLKEYKIGGEAFVDFSLKQTGPTSHEISNFTFASKKLGCEYNEKNVSIAGKIFADDIVISENQPVSLKVKTDKLAFDIAGYSGYALGDVTWDRGDTDGQFTLLCREFNLKGFANWLEGQKQQKNVKRAPRLTAQQKNKLACDAKDFIASVKPVFEKMNISGKMSFNKFVGYDEAVQKYYDFEDVDVSLFIDRGIIAIEYSGGLAGGLSRGKFYTDISKPSPTIGASTEMLDVTATETLRPQIQKDFPGNFVTGTFTNIKEYTCKLTDFWASLSDDRYPLIMRGTGKMIANKGYVIGKAAPDAVTKIFPGLNLTEYHYNQMTAYQEYLDNGSSVNDAIFSGTSYDVCMEGTTDIDKNIDYMTGLQILGSLTSSDWKHDWKQGRLPILKVRGRIENGKLVDQVVTYPWPVETWGDIFVKNNVLYRAWLLKKQNQQEAASNTKSTK